MGVLRGFPFSVVVELNGCYVAGPSPNQDGDSRLSYGFLPDRCHTVEVSGVA